MPASFPRFASLPATLAGLATAGSRPAAPVATDANSLGTSPAYLGEVG